MRTRNLALLLSGALVFGTVIAPSGDAASMVAPKVNHLTFSGAVGLPGVTLPRGTYTFELIPLRPDIVRVLSRDRLQLYFTGFTREIPRPTGPAANRLVTLAETRPGQAPRITAWYPIGESTGRQFLYPDVTR
ncbi:MAG: hypothetical protein HYY76_18690 [Acidobacteria bacterium]|nr:hypothetical protein [Acidobacteriota bacterium]